MQSVPVSICWPCNTVEQCRVESGVLERTSCFFFFNVVGKCNHCSKAADEDERMLDMFL